MIIINDLSQNPCVKDLKIFTFQIGNGVGEQLMKVNVNLTYLIPTITDIHNTLANPQDIFEHTFL